MRGIRAVVPMLAVAVAVAACELAASSAAPSFAASDEVFRVEVGGGLAGIDPSEGLPLIAVYGDGRAFRPGAVPAIDPAPLVRPVAASRVTGETIARLLALAADNGLLRDAHYDLPGLFDAETTTVTIAAGSKVYRQSVYALGFDEGDAGLDAATVAGRRNVASFVSALLTMPSTPLPEDVPSGLRIHVGPAADVPGDSGASGGVDVPWPLAGDLATFGEPSPPRGLRCGLVSGVDVATLWPVLKAANVRTTFLSNGARYRVTVRQLLPGESGGC